MSYLNYLLLVESHTGVEELVEAVDAAMQLLEGFEQRRVDYFGGLLVSWRGVAFGS